MKNALGLLTALDEPLFELALDGSVVAASAAAQALIGNVVAGASAPFADLLLKRDRARFEQAFKRVADGKTTSVKLELGIAAAGAVSGDTLPMEAKIAAITAANGKPTGVGLWLRDLSLEKANEAAANVQGTHLLDLVDNVSDACVVESADGAVEMLNDAFCRLFDVKAAPQSMVGTSCAALFEAASIATQQRIGPLYFPLDSSSGSNQRDELEFQLVSGEAILQASLAVDGELGIAGRLHLFRPKAPRAAADSAAGSSDHASVNAGHAALIEKIARDLIYANERSGSAFYRAEQLEIHSPVLDKFRRVATAVDSALDAVAGLLDFARLESDLVTLNIAPFKLRERVAAMIAGVMPHIEGRHIQLKVHIEQDVPDQLVGDADRLMMALRHLLDCTILALPVFAGPPSPEEKPTDISLNISPEYSADNLIHLAFAVEETIRSSTPRAKVIPAVVTMRLALARQIVRAIVGASSGARDKAKLEIHERKLGTTYQFTAAFPFDATREPVTRPTYVTLTGLPILIVSEDMAERKELAEMAKSWRMQPREADNAEVALQLLTRLARDNNPIPLVVTSNTLTGQDGFLLAFRIKHHANPLLRQTAVMMLASSGKPGDAITCRENSISAYLRQPIAAQQLNEAITAVVGAQDDAEATATLITRHSLREQKKAAVLIIDAARDQAMFAAAPLKKKDYRVVLVGSASEAFEAMVQEQFDVVIVDPDDSGFVEGLNIVKTLHANVGEGRELPFVLMASESPTVGPTAYAGLVLKPYAKDSMLNAVTDLLKSRAANSANLANAPTPAKP